MRSIGWPSGGRAEKKIQNVIYHGQREIEGRGFTQREEYSRGTETVELACSPSYIIEIVREKI